MYPVKDEVIDHAALLVEHQRILPLPDFQFLDVIGQKAIEKGMSVNALDKKFAHVGNVKNTGGFPHRLVLLNNAGVLHWHLPSAKLNQARAQFLVSIEKGGFLKGGGVAHT